MQVVHINRLELNSIEFDMESMEIPLSPGEEQSFEIVIINYSSPTHVHISVSDTLKHNVVILEDNPYVTHEDYIPVVVRIPFDGKKIYQGDVYVTVSHGAKKSSFSMILGQPLGSKDANCVQIDDSLSAPNEIYVKNKRSTGTWKEQLPSISAGVLKNGYEHMVSKVTLFLSGILLLLLFILTVSSIFANGISPALGFYLAIVLSILFTAFCVYLLLKLPIFK
ncbi:MAG: hypothetical protein WBL02_02315 [Methanomethylovorans sp.]|uniref:DUF7524 family protein n=1 Tax=Methanomethylovorans sp. TaxID=2758717 RepID=UPI003C71855A